MAAARTFVRIVCAACVGFHAVAATQAAEKLVVKRIFPAGGTAGGKIVVKADGTFPRWPVRIWTDRDGTAWRPLEEKGGFEVTVAAAGSLGVHGVRLHDDVEAAALQRFVVGGVPEIVESEPNERPGEPQAVESLPVTINGVLEKAGDVDTFGVALAAGQTLVADVDAHGGPGAPVDAVLELVDERGGYLARRLDGRGLDPRIVFTAPRAGRYVVRIYGFPATPNSTIDFSGGADHVYRLCLTTGGFLAGTLPTVVARSGTTVVLPLGWNLPAQPPAVPVVVPAGADAVWIGFAGVTGVAQLPVVSTERLPIAGRDRAAVEPPFVASNVFAAAGEEIFQRVCGRKSTPLLVAVESQAIGSEAEAVLEIRAADGRGLLVKSDRDPPAAWTPPEDADYDFVVRDRRGGFGPAHFFRVRVIPAVPELAATCDQDAAALAVGGTVELAISVERLRGWKEPVEFVLVDPPPGISAEPVTSAATGDTAKKVQFTIRGSVATRGPLTVVARLSGAENAAADPVATVRFGREKTPRFWVTVGP